MRILVPGGEGLVGRALRARAAARGLDVVCLPHARWDATDPERREAALRDWRPDAVIFCAAFTEVDRCTEAHRAVHVDAPAAWAARVPTWYLSTNFVFDGPGPHPPEHVPRPRGLYARQKADGEQAVIASGGHVVRVGWVYGPGGRTFASRLADRLRAGDSVRAVADVIVQPTWSEDLADALLALPPGVTHAIGRGETSWYGFALAVHARIGRGRVEPVRLAELGLDRPRDARLSPASLAPWWERVVDAAALTSPGEPPR